MSYFMFMQFPAKREALIYNFKISYGFYTYLLPIVKVFMHDSKNQVCVPTRYVGKSGKSGRERWDAKIQTF